MSLQSISGNLRIIFLKQIMYGFIIQPSHKFPQTLSKPKECDSTKTRLKTLTTKQRELKEFCCTLCKQPRVSLEGGGHWLRLQGYKNLHGTFSFSFPSEIIAVDVIPSNFQSYLLVYGFVSIAIWQSGQPI